MNKKRILSMPLNRELTVTLTGYPLYPIRVGERTWIIHTNGSFLTENVQTILEASYDHFIFKTERTTYHLKYKASIQNTEVISA